MQSDLKIDICGESDLRFDLNSGCEVRSASHPGTSPEITNEFLKMIAEKSLVRCQEITKNFLQDQ